MTKKYLLLLILILCLVYWSFLISGIRVANDYHVPYEELLKSLFNLPFIWSNKWGGGLGHLVVTLWAWPYELLFGFGKTIGLSFEIMERVFGVFPVLFIGAIGLTKLLNEFHLSKISVLVGILFFLINSYIILLVDGGQINLAIAYAILPLAYYLFRKTEYKFSLRSIAIFSISLISISWFDIRVVYLLYILIGIHFVFEFLLNRKKYNTLNFFKTNFLAGLILIGFSLYWIFPILQNKINVVPLTYDRAAQIGFLSFTNLEHSLLLQQPHWYKNLFGNINPVDPSFALIPILVFISPLIYRKNNIVAFWIIVAVISVFLAKGTNPPFGFVYQWLFENFPGFVIFRDSTKFFFLVALSYSILIAFSVDRLSRFLLDSKYKRYSFILPVLVVSYFIILARPAFLSQMTGMFSKPIYYEEFQSLNNYIPADNKFGRVVWIPNKSPIGFESPLHPAVDAYNLLEKRPFAAGAKGTYETLNFFREASYSGELMDVSGIKYIAYPPLDTRRDDLDEDKVEYYSTFLNQLSSLSWVKGRVNESKIPLLAIRNVQDRFFTTPNLLWVVGSDDIYNSFADDDQLNLSDNALVFTDENPGLSQRLIDYPEAKIILNNKTNLDFTASFIINDNLIFPAASLKFDPDKSGWWKRETADLVAWKSFLFEKYNIVNNDFDLGGGWAIGEGDLDLTLSDIKITKDSILLARVMESSQSGSLSFSQENNLIGKIDTRINNIQNTNIRWFEVGKLTDNNNLTIHSSGNINVINALAIMKADQWNDLKTKSDRYKKVIVDLKSIKSKSKPNIEYTRINPTKYEVIITGLKEPTTLVFSESFNSLWQINNQSSLPIYSMLNGYRIEKDGKYILEFTPQRYVYLGLIGTFITTVVIFLILRKK